MFNLESSIAAWREQMLAAGIKAPVPLDELEIHLREEIERQVKSGTNGQQAFEMAALQIGKANALKMEFRKADQQHTRMKSIFAVFLQVIIVLIGIGALAFLLGEPHIEGRNAHATTFEIYFKDPFLAYVYAGSIPFFVTLYRAFGLLGRVRQNRAFSQAAVDALQAIKHCAIVMIGFVAGGVVFILMFGDKDDRPAGFFMCLLVTFAASVMAITAAIFARNLQNALRQSEGG